MNVPFFSLILFSNYVIEFRRFQGLGRLIQHLYFISLLTNICGAHTEVITDHFTI